MIQEFSYGIVPLYKNAEGELEILLVQQKGGGHRAFPKGHIEFAESPLQAAYRELNEETGIRNIEVNETALFEMHYNYTHTEDRVEIEKYVGFYIGYVKEKEVQINEQEILAFKRVLLEKATDEVTYSAAKDLVLKIKKYIETEVTIS